MNGAMTELLEPKLREQIQTSVEKRQKPASLLVLSA
jgi:hypothetical protein